MKIDTSKKYLIDDKNEESQNKPISETPVEHLTTRGILEKWKLIDDKYLDIDTGKKYLIDDKNEEFQNKPISEIPVEHLTIRGILEKWKLVDDKHLDKAFEMIDGLEENYTNAINKEWSQYIQVGLHLYSKDTAKELGFDYFAKKFLNDIVDYGNGINRIRKGFDPGFSSAELLFPERKIFKIENAEKIEDYDYRYLSESQAEHSLGKLVHGAKNLATLAIQIGSLRVQEELMANDYLSKNKEELELIARSIKKKLSLEFRRDKTVTYEMRSVMINILRYSFYGTTKVTFYEKDFSKERKEEAGVIAKIAVDPDASCFPDGSEKIKNVFLKYKEDDKKDKDRLLYYMEKYDGYAEKLENFKEWFLFDPKGLEDISREQSSRFDSIRYGVIGEEHIEEFQERRKKWIENRKKKIELIEEVYGSKRRELIGKSNNICRINRDRLERASHIYKKKVLTSIAAIFAISIALIVITGVNFLFSGIAVAVASIAAYATKLIFKRKMLTIERKVDNESMQTDHLIIEKINKLIYKGIENETVSTENLDEEHKKVLHGYIHERRVETISYYKEFAIERNEEMLNTVRIYLYELLFVGSEDTIGAKFNGEDKRMLQVLFSLDIYKDIIRLLDKTLKLIDESGSLTDEDFLTSEDTKKKIEALLGEVLALGDSIDTKVYPSKLYKYTAYEAGKLYDSIYNCKER